MMRFYRLFWFQFKLYASNQYFLWLTLSSTTAIFWLQYLSAYAANDLSNPHIWLRSGVFGLWASATTAVGSIGFQRYQGTLPYLVNGQLDARIVLLTVILPAASFGLLAFPLAYLWAIILGVTHGGLTLSLIGSILCLWLAASLMDLLIAGFFVLTPNALVYEDLLMVPILLACGLFGTFPGLTVITQITQWIIPIGTPISAILTQRPLAWAPMITSMLLWGGLTWRLTRYLLRRAKRSGLLGVM